MKSTNITITMKKIMKFAVCLAAMLLTFSAYASEKDLYGRWVLSQVENGIIAMTSFDFHEDGGVNMKLLVQSSSPKMELEADASGTYTYKGSTATCKFNKDDIEISKLEIDGLSGSLREMAIQQQKSEMAKSDIKITDISINGNVMTATIEGETVTLNKIQ